MRSLGFAALLVAIVAVTQENSPAYAGKVSPGGNKIDWVASYPFRSTALGVEPPTVKTKFTVTVNTGWTANSVDFDISRFANIDGTGYNGKDHKTILQNFSEEYSWNVVDLGKSIKVTSIKLTCSDGTNQDFATEVDSGVVQIRN